MTIESLLKINLSDIPDETYIKGNTQINDSGDKIINYRKLLQPKVFGLFDTIEVKVFEAKQNKNIIFHNFDFNIKDVEKVRDLTDNLYLLYGLDSSQKGKFKSNEIEELENDYWSGRYWEDDQTVNPVMFAFDEISGLSLTIWKTD